MLNQGDKIVLPDTYYIVERVERRSIWFRELRRTKVDHYYHLSERGNGSVIVLNYQEFGLRELYLLMKGSLLEFTDCALCLSILLCSSSYFQILEWFYSLQF